MIYTNGIIPRENPNLPFFVNTQTTVYGDLLFHSLSFPHTVVIFLCLPSIKFDLFFALNFFCSPEWANHFYPRNLVAMTAEPLLLYPTHYVGDEGYFSDTETTGLIPPELQQTDTLKGKVEL